MTLHLPTRALYFDQIANGEKLEEYRLVTEYWQKRLDGHSYSRIVLTRCYPKGGGVCQSKRSMTPAEQVRALAHMSGDLLQHIDWLTCRLPDMLEKAALTDEEGLIGAAVDAANAARAALSSCDIEQIVAAMERMKVG